jgi:hypothetical protein
MSNKPLSQEELYNSYKAYEKRLAKDLKDGTVTREQAHSFLKSAKKNYGNQSYNRELEKVLMMRK